MKTIELADAMLPLSDYAEAARSGPIVLTRDGHPVAAVVAVSDTDIESLSVETNPVFLSLLERARARLLSEGAVSHADLRSRLGLPTMATGNRRRR